MVNFNEAYAPSSISTSNLTLSQGTVTGAVQTNSTTVTYTISGLTSDAIVNYSIAAGAVTDIYGGAGAAYFGTLTLENGPQAFPTLTAVNPVGSLIYKNSVGSAIAFSGDADQYTLSLAAGQTLTVLGTPSIGLQPKITLTGPGLSTSVSSSGPGGPAMLQSIAIATTGTYTITVTGLSGTTGSYTLAAYLNAALSTAASGGAPIGTISAAQNIDGSFVSVGGGAQRGAVSGTVASVVGPDAFGYSAITVAPQFNDISASGTVISGLSGVDDGFVSVSPGFTFSFYGTQYNNFYISSNGLITFGNGETYFTNTNLTSSSQSAPTPPEPTIAPFWDDMVVTGQTQSHVYYQLVGSGASQQLIIQWNDVSFYRSGHNPNYTGPLTFEAILNANGTILFNYKNLTSPADAGSGGASATVGIKGSGSQSPGGDVLLVSFNNANSPYVGTGLSTEIGVGLSATDYYSFSAVAGQTVTLAATSQSSSAVQVALVNAQGATLATSTTLNTNVSAAIDNFVITTSGTYYAAVSGSGGTPYSLVVNRNADFDTKTGTSLATAQNISGSQGVLGAIQAATPQDWYAVNLTAGSGLLLQTVAQGSTTAQFIDNLSPQIQLYNASGTLLASGTGSGSQTISYLASSAGTYYVKVTGSGGSIGEYFLRAAVDLTPPAATITAVSPNPRNTAVAQLQIVFNEPVSGMSLAALSLTLNGGPNLLNSATQSLTTQDNMTFTLTNLASITAAAGTYTLALNPNSSITDPLGFSLTAGASASFTVVTSAPQVTGVYVSGGSAWSAAFYNYLSSQGLGDSQLGYRLPGGAGQLLTLPWNDLTTISVVFSQNVIINTSQSGLALAGSADLSAPPSLGGAKFSYSSSTDTATWTFTTPLTNDKYLLAIPSAAVANTLGTPLDGEFTNAAGSTPGGTFPSGDGNPGGDFDFRFNVLPGDTSRDGVVTGADGTAVQNRLQLTTASGNYSAFDDIDGDGTITTTDSAAVRSQLLQRLPNSEPIAPTVMGPQSSVAPTAPTAPTTPPASTAPPAAPTPPAAAKPVAKAPAPKPAPKGAEKKVVAIASPAKPKTPAVVKPAVVPVAAASATKAKSPAAAIVSPAVVVPKAAVKSSAATAAELTEIHDALLETFERADFLKRFRIG